MKTEMSYIEAKSIADGIITILKEHCIRIDIAGSVRRQKAIIGDIEIVCIPKPFQTGLFEDGIASVVNGWEKIKGDLPCKYTQRKLHNGVTLDLFFAEPENYGNILLIRTGDWQFSKYFMGTLLPKNGYKQEDGFLKYNGKIIPCYDEQDLFTRAGMRYIQPEDRTIDTIQS